MTCSTAQSAGSATSTPAGTGAAKYGLRFPRCFAASNGARRASSWGTLADEASATRDRSVANEASMAASGAVWAEDAPGQVERASRAPAEASRGLYTRAVDADRLPTCSWFLCVCVQLESDIRFSAAGRHYLRHKADTDLGFHMERCPGGVPARTSLWPRAAYVVLCYGRAMRQQADRAWPCGVSPRN